MLLAGSVGAPNASFNILTFESRRGALSNCSTSLFVVSSTEPKFMNFNGRLFPDGQETLSRLMGCVCDRGCTWGPQVTLGEWHHVAFGFSDGANGTTVSQYMLDGQASIGR
eukprot:SAG22_NODE_10628_length_524_cov_0.868235_1_plen_110_part_01